MCKLCVDGNTSVYGLCPGPSCTIMQKGLGLEAGQETKCWVLGAGAGGWARHEGPDCPIFQYDLMLTPSLHASSPICSALAGNQLSFIIGLVTILM